MIKGETVIVELVEQVGVDDFNTPIFEPAGQVEVNNVLVEIGEPADVRDSTRDGNRIIYTLRWPKVSYMVLDDLRVNVRGEWFSIVGSPRQFDPEQCPTEWNMTVKLEAYHG